MKLDELLDELDRKGFLRPTSADPRKPPALPGSTSGQVWSGDLIDTDQPNESDLYPVNVGTFLFPIKDNAEIDLGDWLEESNCDQILEGFDLYKDEHKSIIGSPYRDVWAWYCPFHVFEDEFGIYIRGDKLPLLSQEILRQANSTERAQIKSTSPRFRRLFGAQLKQAAFLHLFLHEMYHHKIESFCTRLEIAQNLPKFVPYFESVYRPLTQPLSDGLVEEGLANADVIRRVVNERTYRHTQLPQLRSLPHVRVLWERFEIYAAKNCTTPGYRNVRRYLGNRDRFLQKRFFEDQRSLQQAILHCVAVPLGDSEQWRYSPDTVSAFWNKDIIVYEIVHPHAGPVIAPHGTMPAVQASPSKVVRAARKWGIHKEREGRGDHTVYRGLNGMTVSIDTGYNDLPHPCWGGLIAIINHDHGLKLRNNQEGRRRFLMGP